MSTAEPRPVPYDVFCSERVRQRLLTLAGTARQRGDGEEFLAGLKEFHRPLTLYPQFGEPLADLMQEASPGSQTPVWGSLSSKLRFVRHDASARNGASQTGVPKQEFGNEGK